MRPIALFALLCSRLAALPLIGLAALPCMGLAAPARAASLSSADSAFLRSAARGANYELAIARLAQQKATRSDVKAYAATLVGDHDQLNSGLRQLAQSKGVTWPTGMEDAEKAKLGTLQGLAGAAFDRAFLADEAEVNGQDKDVLSKETRSSDADVSAFARRMQEADTRHQKLGEALRGRG